MKFGSCLLTVLAILVAVSAFVGCSETDSTPILAFGKITTDDDNYNYSFNGHAYVRIINTSDDDVVAEVKIENIQLLPQPYQIRMKYHEAFTDYWADYVIECKYYNSTSDNTVDMQCRQAIDITAYDRKIDLNIE